MVRGLTLYFFPPFDHALIISGVDGAGLTEVGTRVEHSGSQSTADVSDYGAKAKGCEFSAEPRERGLTGDFAGGVYTAGGGNEWVIVESANEVGDGRETPVVGHVAAPKNFGIVSSSAESLSFELCQEFFIGTLRIASSSLTIGGT